MTPFMKLGLSQIKTGENAFSFSTSEESWLKTLVDGLTDKGISVAGPVSVQLQLTKLEPDYFLKGQLSFTADQVCARCAEVFSLPMEHSFALGLAHVETQGRGKAPDLLLAEESDELDINYFEGTELDLAPIVEEQLLLSLPYTAVCRPDCRGLCQSCGADLNQGSCRCAQLNPLSPFTALSQLKH